METLKILMANKDFVKPIPEKGDKGGRVGATLQRQLLQCGVELLQADTFEETDGIRKHRSVTYLGINGEFGLSTASTISHTFDKIIDPYTVYSREDAGEILKEVDRILKDLSSK